MKKPIVDEQGILQGVFVDTKGTLLLDTGHNFVLNHELHKILVDLLDNQIPVFVVSSTTNLGRYFRSAGVDTRLGYPHNRDSFIGHYAREEFSGAEEFQFVIDDDVRKSGEDGCMGKMAFHPNELVANWSSKWKAVFEKEFGVKLKNIHEVPQGSAPPKGAEPPIG